MWRMKLQSRVLIQDAFGLVALLRFFWQELPDIPNMAPVLIQLPDRPSSTMDS